MSSKKFALETMSVDDLWSLHERISGILSTRIKAEKHELEKRLAILSRGLAGQTGNSGAPGERPRRRYPVVLPKLSEPANFRNLVRARQATALVDCRHEVRTQNRGISNPGN
jgi:hypothetical protein